MSVYTAVDERELSAFLARFELGAARAFNGIEAGIENSNWFLTTECGEYVLTVFEHAGSDELRWYLGLMARLCSHGIPCAAPQRARGGAYLEMLKGKPAAIVARLSGTHVEYPDERHCRALGQQLARIHAAASDYGPERHSTRGPGWRARVTAALRGQVGAADARLLDAAEAAAADDPDDLPAGVIHADLFRDNALFDGARLSGVLDFYYAHHGAFVYDLAVAFIDWCIIPGGQLEKTTARALVAGYDEVRALTPPETERWPAMVQAAASRFWLSRLHDLTFPRDGELVQVKDPTPFRAVFDRALTYPDEFSAILR